LHHPELARRKNLEILADEGQQHATRPDVVLGRTLRLALTSGARIPSDAIG
jgi:hypothetical protein